MTWDTGIADRVRAKGVVVVEVAGWQTRGSTSLDPVGSGNHHTAGPKYGTSPSLATCIYGRPDVNGPLCNVMQGRHLDTPMLDPAYIVAAGKANHGGKGAWRGVSGNSRFYGLEIEHTGLAPVHPDRLEVAARIQAALLEGAGRDASWLWQHYEYALPPGRKIDFFDLSPWSADQFRARVAYWIGRTPTDPTPSQEDDDDMLSTEAKDWLRKLVHDSEARQNAFISQALSGQHQGVPILVRGSGVYADGTKAPTNHAAKWWAISANGAEHIDSQARANSLIYAGQVIADARNQPFVWAQDLVDANLDPSQRPQRTA